MFSLIMIVAITSLTSSPTISCQSSSPATSSFQSDTPPIEICCLQYSRAFPPRASGFLASAVFLVHFDENNSGKRLNSFGTFVTSNSRKERPNAFNEKHGQVFPKSVPTEVFFCKLQI
jgi:hypothetical protein